MKRSQEIRPKFTKQHYKEIASILTYIEDKSVRRYQALLYCDKFAADNVRFRKGQFLTACGIEQ